MVIQHCYLFLLEQQNSTQWLSMEFKFFRTLGLCEQLVEACDSLRSKTPSKIQVEAIPHAFEGSIIYFVMLNYYNLIAFLCMSIYILLHGFDEIESTTFQAIFKWPLFGFLCYLEESSRGIIIYPYILLGMMHKNYLIGWSSPSDQLRGKWTI